MMKKLISIVMIMFLLIGVMASNVSAAESCTVSVGANKTSVKVGDTVTVTVNFSVPVGGASPVILNYNSSVLEYTGSNVIASNSGSSVKLSYIDRDFTNQTISSMSVTFKAKATGTSNCSVSSARISNEKGSKYNVSIGGGTTITVAGTTTTKPSTNTTKPNNNTSKAPTFTNVNQTVYATTDTNVRTSWSTSSSAVTTLKKGDSLKRTGIGNNGWSRVVYNGRTLYIYSANLTTTKPKEDDKKDDKKDDENKNNTNNEVTNNTVNNEVANNVVNNEVVNNEENANNGIGNIIGNNEVRPGDEEKPDYIFYIIILIIIIAIIIIIISTIREERRNRKNKRK